MNERPGFGDVLCASVSDARFLIIDPGTAVRMPSLDGVPLDRGKPQPCSRPPLPADDCHLLGGQQYVDRVTGLTLLCVWPGRGSLTCEGRRMAETIAVQIPDRVR